MKTIEEAAVIAATNYDNPFDEPAYDKKFYDGFLAGANHIMSLPLTDRLTAEEREKIKAIYCEAQQWLDEKPDLYNSHLRTMAVVLQDRLEHIFGKSMFAEEGGSHE